VSVAPATVSASSRPRALGRRFARLQSRYPILQVVAVGAVFAYGALTLPGLASLSSIKLILVLASLTGLAAVGQTLLILMGGFDLSIAGFVVASGLLVTQVKSEYNIPFGVALLIALAGAGTLGAIAGQICHRLELNPLIVTLAMGTIGVGIVESLAPGGLTVGAAAPQWLITFTSPAGRTLGVGIPPIVVVWAIVTVLMGLFLHKTISGRRLLATGANQQGAEYSLIKTRKIWTIAFAFSAMTSVLLGLLVSGFAGAITTDSGDPYLFQGVVAVIIGGTVFGGPGDYTRTVIGAIFLTVVDIVLVGHGATEADQQILYGAAILLAMSLYSRERRLRDRV
jgi:ribose transport system permease protein